MPSKSSKRSKPKVSDAALIIEAPIPPSSNHLYPVGRGGKRFLGKQGKQYKEFVKTKMMVEGAKKKCPDPPFSACFHFFMPDKRRRDLDNYRKVLTDSIFEYLEVDDSLIHESRDFKYLDRRNPGVKVELRHCDKVLEV